MTDIEHLTRDLPDADAARRFLASFEEHHARDAAKLRKNDGLLSDVLTLASYSPLLATTMLQNPEYVWWLNRKRQGAAVRTKEELLEALGRFVLTHTQLDLHAQLARFRRRELLRIFLSDIRRLTTIAEITEDISNLADAILETALRRAQQEMDNRFGGPLVVGDKNRKTPAEFCIVSLGKLGSRELNYSSDIDLLFLYSDEGMTAGAGTRGTVTNREYFVKLSEAVVQLVGKQTGEGAAYRVDMRLRPHGRVGPLAMSVDDTIRYYRGEARDWERQVLIRSRASAGDADVYRRFIDAVESAVFSENVTVESALAAVRSSKQRIDLEQRSDRGFNVKLGRGGIREIEFIAQALQLAYGGSDQWLRSPHTLISLSRLADRELISETQQTQLFNAYEFLRHLEHVLQMEHGLQAHAVPDEPDRRTLVARRMGCEHLADFERDLTKHTENVHSVFERVFESKGSASANGVYIRSDVAVDGPVLTEEPERTETLPSGSWVFTRDEYLERLRHVIAPERDFRHRMGAFRREWTRLQDEIRTADRNARIDTRTAKRRQTALAEASLDAALDITRDELERRYRTKIDRLPMAVMGLGKLGGAAIDYASDLDLVLVFDSDTAVVNGVTDAEFYSRAAEIFVTTLSSMTRDGSIYRVDLRLRPYGKNGQSVISAKAFAEYMRETAAIWEWLAYVKIRAVAGDMKLAGAVEAELRGIIHDRAAGINARELADETRRVRIKLEKEKTGRRRSKEIDIKYGPGGMLDVYFAMRYLQLRDNVPDDPDNRSTENVLEKLHRNASLELENYEAMLHGYRFLSALDHNLRLTVGRTNRLPSAHPKLLEAVATRANLSSSAELNELLTVHRLNIRTAFDDVLGPIV